MMESRADSYFSIKITRLLMKLVGCWISDNKKEEITRKCILYYTILAIITAMFTAGFDFYFSFDDFYGATYTACALMPVVLGLVKIIGFMVYRPLLLNIISYTRDNFWNREYDDFGKAILHDTNRKGIFLVCSFTFFVQGTVVCYITTPLVENIGKNNSDRILAFNIWLDVPTSETPYYELFSIMLALICVHAGLCFCCFDNFLSMLNIHAAAQFKILQNRIETICDIDDTETTINNDDYRELHRDEYSDACYNKFKDCVRQHQALIRYVEDLEHVFTFLVLGQLLVSSVMLCVAGFQVAQVFSHFPRFVLNKIMPADSKAQGTIVRRLIFIAHTMGSIFQLLVITITANEVIVESDGIGNAAYSTLWNHLPYDFRGKKLREGLVLMMVRTRKPCCITAGRFFPVSLETFTKVTTTSMSYFTMLRQVEADISEV